MPFRSAPVAARAARKVVPSDELNSAPPNPVSQLPPPPPPPVLTPPSLLTDDFDPQPATRSSRRPTIRRIAHPRWWFLVSHGIKITVTRRRFLKRGLLGGF